jgi:predicted RNA binding protein YcfA (HicA-like mRNA interferase family)
LSCWPSCKAKRVRKALAKIGWGTKPGKKGSSHQQLVHPKLPEYTWAFHDGDEIGPRMLASLSVLGSNQKTFKRLESSC